MTQNNGVPEMPKDDFITVVFKCPADSVLRKEVMTAFKDNKPFKDAQITAVSLEDEISRVEQLELELENEELLIELPIAT
jgi:hypothetical protein